MEGGDGSWGPLAMSSGALVNSVGDVYLNRHEGCPCMIHCAKLFGHLKSSSFSVRDLGKRMV